MLSLLSQVCKSSNILTPITAVITVRSVIFEWEEKMFIYQNKTKNDLNDDE